MKASFNLVSPTAATSSVRLVITHKGKVYRYSVGVSLPTKCWKKTKKGQGPTREQDQKALNAILEKLTTLNDYSTEAEILKAVDAALGKQAVEGAKTRFWPYFEEWSERNTPSKRYRSLARRKIAEVMGTEDDWNDITGDWYFRFQQKMKDGGYSLNYISTITNKLRTVMKEGQDRGMHNNAAYKSFPKKFETADTIYLTKEEIAKISKLSLKSQEEQKARDLFLLGYYTASRYQNYSKLSKDNIADGKIRFIQPKTGGAVVIPCAPKVLSILDKWGGKAPALSEANYNLAIKRIAKKAGLTDKVETRITKGGRLIIKTNEKWELVTSHTARRSGATNLYLSGVPIRICRFLTGHRDDATFLKYIKVTKEEAADILAGSDFFK